MILIHLFAGVVFGLCSIVFSIYAGHGFLVGLLRYSVIGAGGMCLSAALSLIPVGAVIAAIQAAFRPDPRGKAFTPRTFTPYGPLEHGGFRPDAGRPREM